MKNIYAFYILLFFLSCKSDKSMDVSGIISIPVDINQSEPALMSKHFESIEYILLDYDDSLPIARPTYIKFFEEDIFAQDRGLDNIIQFNRNGEVKRIFQSTGIGGPGEFMQVENFQVREDTLLISDARQNKILAFSHEGEHLFTEKSPYRLSDVFYTPNFQLYHLNNAPESQDRSNFIRISPDTTIGWYPIRTGYENYMFRTIHGFYTDPFSRDILFNVPLSYDVILFDYKGHFRKILQFDFKQGAISDDLRLRIKEIPNRNEFMKEQKLVEFLHCFFPFSDQYFLGFNRRGDGNYFIFLDKNFKIKSQISRFVNDLDGMEIRNIPWTFTEDEIVYMIPSLDFYDDFKKSEDNILKIDAEAPILDFVKRNKSRLEDDRYVLVVLKVK
ncbi:6-bladed beta-propeller [Cognataquiflexum rubidum]|uniref:6-bladed beta-propeller n=1 Tax=Cognataquiflexum rubidum TaxID=2922273 RepID=UPI001F13F21A|nr:6-bladed beta-propeller [Cognataquiflexum rubidum]MCH6236150.1 6-bladed beta-propeller [Cognataquiflexum rubidum]